MKTTRLPDKLSDLLILALTDLEQVEKDPRYRVNMGLWHYPRPFGSRLCRVCLAGSVMAKTLGEDPTVAASPWDLPTAVRNKLFALDSARDGSVSTALEWLGSAHPEWAVDGREWPERAVDGREWPVYVAGVQGEDWWLVMQNLIGVLQAEGL